MKSSRNLGRQISREEIEKVVQSCFCAFKRFPREHILPLLLKLFQVVEKKESP